MPRATSRGKCEFCGGEFGKAQMTRHLANCPQRAGTAPTSRAKAQPARLFHLIVEGRYEPIYWMHLEVPADISLNALDQFLRNKWLECCGHLSAYTIDGVRYASDVDPMWGLDDRNMRGVKLGAVAGPGAKFYHEYDFGTTTELNLRVVGEREAEARRNEIRLLAQNVAPVIPCDNCGAPASEVCSQCIYEGRGWLCAECAPAHGCGEEMLLPVVNSPRVGMCGYMG